MICRQPRPEGAVTVVDLAFEKTKAGIEGEGGRVKEREREKERESYTCILMVVCRTLREGERAKTEMPGACEACGHARP